MRAGVQAVRAFLLHDGRAGLGDLLAHCLRLGEKAKVVIDTVYHAPGTNIEFIVAVLLRAAGLGAFDFNSRFYADDDLMVGAADPFQLFRILIEVVLADALNPDVEFMLDQCDNIEDKIPGQVRSVMNAQQAGEALMVDHSAGGGPASGDVLGANGVLMDAFETDVRPCWQIFVRTAVWHATRWRPIASGYRERIIAERVGGAPAGWGA